MLLGVGRFQYLGTKTESPCLPWACLTLFVASYAGCHTPDSVNSGVIMRCSGEPTTMVEMPPGPVCKVRRRRKKKWENSPKQDRQMVSAAAHSFFFLEWKIVFQCKS